MGTSLLLLVAVAVCAIVSPALADYSFIAPGHYDTTHNYSSAALFGWMNNETLSGIMAAFLEANNNGGVRGQNFTAVPIEDEAQASRVLELVAPHMLAPTNLGVLTPYTLTAIGTNELSRIYKIPSFGPLSMEDKNFDSTKANFEYNIHLRLNAGSEGTAMLNFALNSNLYCKQFYIPYVTAFGIDDHAFRMRRDLARLGFPEPLMSPFPLATNITAFTAAFGAAIGAFAFANPRPNCVLFMVDLSIATELVPLLHQRVPGFDAANTHFLMPSFGQVPRYAKDGDPSFFNNFYQMQQLPHPSATSFTMIQKYIASLTALKASGYSRGASFAPNGFSVEGYVAARFVVEAVRRVDPDKAVTRQSIRDAVYSTRMFPIDDIVLGPFGAGCTGGQNSDTGPCFCNSGLRQVFAARVNGTTGTTYPLTDDPDFPGVARAPVPMTACELDASSLKTPFIITTPRDPAVGAVIAARGGESDNGEAAQARMTAALRAAVIKARSEERLDQGPVYPTTSSVAGFSNTTLAQLVIRSRLVLVAGAQYDTAAVYASAFPLIDLAPLGSAFLDRDEDWVPIADHKPWRIPFYPMLVDLAMTGASYIATMSTLDNDKTYIIADTSVLQGYAVKCVETKAQVAPLGSAVVDRTSAATIQAAFDAIPSTARGTTASVLVVSRTKGVLEAAQRFAAAAGVTATVFLAADEFVLSDSMLPSAQIPANRVVFASGLPNYDDGAGSARAAYARAVADTAMALYEQRTNGTAAAVMEAAYRSSGVNVGSIAAAPLYSATCGAITAPVWPHPGGECQCTKGLSVFHVMEAQARAANTTGQTGKHTFRHSGCGVAFQALPPVPSSGLTSTEKLLIGVGAAVGGLVVIGAVGTVVFLFFFSRGDTRDNKNAPKDARKPFAMVFTDIQSSTNLWAALPEVMGDALDAHHRLMREAVEDCKGYEVKTIGDSFMVAFEHATNAMDFALQVQATLYNHDFQSSEFDELYRAKVKEALLEMGTEESKAAANISQDDYDALWNGIRVRVGVHYGNGDIKFDVTSKGYDYYGTVVNTAARVEGVGHGGQVLMTAAAYNAVCEENNYPSGDDMKESRIPADKAFVKNLGPQPLRGLPEPVGLYEVLPIAFAGRFFPPLRLDVEVEVQEDPDTAMEAPAPNIGDGATTHRSNSTASALNLMDPESFATDVCKRIGYRTPNAPQRVLQFFHALKATLSTAKPKDRKDIALSLADNWRVKQMKKSTHLRRYEVHFQEYFWVMIVAAKVMHSVSTTAHAQEKDGRVRASVTSSAMGDIGAMMRVDTANSLGRGLGKSEDSQLLMLPEQTTTYGDGSSIMAPSPGHPRKEDSGTVSIASPGHPAPMHPNMISSLSTAASPTKGK